MVHPHNLLFNNDWKLVLALEVTSLIELTGQKCTSYYPGAVVWLTHPLIYRLSPGTCVILRAISNTELPPLRSAQLLSPLNTYCMFTPILPQAIHQHCLPCVATTAWHFSVKVSKMPKPSLIRHRPQYKGSISQGYAEWRYKCVKLPAQGEFRFRSSLPSILQDMETLSQDRMSPRRNVPPDAWS